MTAIDANTLINSLTLVLIATIGTVGTIWGNRVNTKVNSVKDQVTGPNGDSLSKVVQESAQTLDAIHTAVIEPGKD